MAKWKDARKEPPEVGEEVLVFDKRYGTFKIASREPAKVYYAEQFREEIEKASHGVWVDQTGCGNPIDDDDYYYTQLPEPPNG